MEDIKVKRNQLFYNGYKYKTTRNLGLGSYSEVWEVIDTTSPSKEKYALKIPHYSLLYDIDESIIKENVILMECNHPNIAKAKHVFYDKGVKAVCTVMYLANDTLAFVMKGKPFPPEYAYNVTKQILCGLEYLDKRGIVHADIKPSNILIFPNDVIKITDFGTSMFCRSRNKCPTSEEKVTLPYRAPELFTPSTKYVSHKIDMWAFGCVLYFMLNGQHLFLGREDDEIKNFVIDEKVMNDILTNTYYDSVFRCMFMASLITNPQKRCSASNCLDILDKIEFSFKEEILTPFPKGENKHRNKLINMIAALLKDDEYDFPSRILLASISIFDRFINYKKISDENIKFFIGAAYMIAVKLIVDVRDATKDYNTISTISYEPELIKEWVIFILETLKFDLNYPNALTMALEDTGIDDTIKIINETTKMPPMSDHIKYREVI